MRGILILSALLCLVTNARADKVALSIMAIDLGAKEPLLETLAGEDMVDTQAFALTNPSPDGDCSKPGVTRRAKAKTVSITKAPDGTPYETPLDVPCPAGINLNLAAAVTPKSPENAQKVMNKVHNFLSRLAMFVAVGERCSAGGVISAGDIDATGDALRTDLRALSEAPAAGIFSGGVKTANGRVSASGGAVLGALGVTDVSCSTEANAPACKVTIPNTQKSQCNGANASTTDSDRAAPKDVAPGANGTKAEKKPATGSKADAR